MGLFFFREFDLRLRGEEWVKLAGMESERERHSGGKLVWKGRDGLVFTKEQEVSRRDHFAYCPPLPPRFSKGEIWWDSLGEMTGASEEMGRCGTFC